MNNNSHMSPSSSYSSDFVNLFGVETRTNDGSNGSDGGNDGEGTVSQSASVPPGSLLAEGPPVSEELNNSNITPSILLEQLAYVDNFMPSLEQDYATLDSWILTDGQDGSGQHNNAAQASHSLGFDERLAAELSAFADDSFIFPDEDKRHFSDKDDDLNDDKEMDNNEGENNGNTAQSNSHFLTQRRNTFLTSQYDHSKSRFWSRRRRVKEQSSSNSNTDLNTNANANANGDGNEPLVPSPVQDHGGFTNVDITPSGSSSLLYAPNVPSPLTNLVASQPYSVSNSPEATASRTSNSSNKEPFPTANNGAPRIQVPDYSKIPTSTLVALLPRVTVPPTAYRSLLNQGLTSDQIDAIAVIIAHHEQEKQRQKQSGHFSEPQGLRGRNVDDASKGASFLINILSNDSHQERSAQPSPGIENALTERRPSPVSVKSDSSLGKLGDVKTLKDLPRDEQAADNVRSDFPVKSESSMEEAQILKKLKLSKQVSKSVSTAQKGNPRKRLKETELESSVHELSELATSLQQKIHTLEMENELLKNLVISSGELEGIERAEKIKKELLKKINETERKVADTDTQKDLKKKR